LFTSADGHWTSVAGGGITKDNQVLTSAPEYVNQNHSVTGNTLVTLCSVTGSQAKDHFCLWNGLTLVRQYKPQFVPSEFDSLYDPNLGANYIVYTSGTNVRGIRTDTWTETNNKVTPPNISETNPIMINTPTGPWLATKGCGDFGCYIMIRGWEGLVALVISSTGKLEDIVFANDHFIVAEYYSSNGQLSVKYVWAGAGQYGPAGLRW